MTRALIVLLLLACAHAAAAQCTAFQPPARYSSTAGRALLVADLDGDGAPEIVASGNHVDELGAFSLFANRGDGTFADERLLASGFGEKLEDAGDLNGDGKIDLLASNYWANGIAVYRGAGALRFEAGLPLNTATHGGPSRIIDYDRDGSPDIVSFSFGSGNPVRVHLFRLEAKKTFETSLANATSPSARIINGALEILVGERSGNLGLVRFSGGAVSVSLVPAGPGFDLASLFADVNGDGVADIIDTNDDGAAGSESIFVTLGKPDGSFLERRRIERPRHVAFPFAVHDGDFDGDHRDDLVVSDLQSSSLYFFQGDGMGGFEEAVPIDAGGPVNDFKAADVNGDGRLDIVTVNGDHSVSVLINRGPCGPARRRAARH